MDKEGRERIRQKIKEEAKKINNEDITHLPDEDLTKVYNLLVEAQIIIEEA